MAASGFRDALAGVSVAGLLLPSAIAYAAIAGLTPEHAIIATIAGLGVYAICGRSRFAMVAPTSSSAAILAALVLSMQPRMPQAAMVAQAAILAAGLCFIVAGLLRAGALASFISRPVLRGFAFGIALTITAKQVPAIAGVKLSIAGGAGVLPLVWRLLILLPHWNFASTALGVLALTGLWGLGRRRGVPASVVVLAAGIGLSAVLHLAAWHIGLVGPLVLAMPMLSWPWVSLEGWSQILQLSLPLFMILFAESWGAIRGLALLHGDHVDSNRELLALGCANIISGLLQGMPVGAGFSASSAAEAAGAASRWAGVAAMAVILLMSLWGQRVIALLPAPVLAAVVIGSLFHALNPAPLVRLWRLRRDELVASAAAMAVLGLGVLDGMLIAVGMSLLAVLQRISGARIGVLGQIAGSHDFVDAQRNKAAEILPGVVILRPMEPLFFANAERVFSDVLARALTLPAARVVIMSLEESPDLDSTALDALLECEAQLWRNGCVLLLARVKDEMREILARAGAGRLASDDSCFWSVADAAAAARRVTAAAMHAK